MSILKQIFSQNAHWQVNKDFAKCYGLQCAVLMSDLIDKWLYFDCPEYFYNTAENIQEDTTLSYYEQKKAINILCENDFIETKLIGIPARLNFKINEEQVINFFQNKFLKNSKTCTEKNQKQEFENFENINNNKENKNKHNNKLNNNTPPQKKSKSKKEVEAIEEKFPFGEHQNVKLSLDEKEKLLQRWGADVFQQIVDKLSNYKLSSGTKYKSDYGAINNWVAKQVEKDNRFSKPLNNNNNGNSQSKSGKQYFNLEPGWSNLTGDEWWMRPYTYKGSTGEDDNVPK